MALLLLVLSYCHLSYHMVKLSTIPSIASVGLISCFKKLQPKTCAKLAYPRFGQPEPEDMARRHCFNYGTLVVRRSDKEYAVDSRVRTQNGIKELHIIYSLHK